MQVKTITTAAGVNEINFGNDSSQSTAHFYWLKNLGDSTLYVSANPNPIAEKDDVAELPAKGAVSVETDEGKIYILGAGKVEIHRTNSKFCPFDWQSSGSGGGGGGSITIDSELSDTSTNPLQNKVTTAAIKEVNSALETKSDINHIHDISASGNPVMMDNLQGGVPFSEMVVKGKNLIPFPYYDGNSKTHNGITFTVNSDGTITANGTATASAIFYISTNYTIKKGIYTLSGCPKSDSNTDYILQFATGDWSFKASDFGNGATILIDNDINLQIFRVAISNGVVCDNLVFRPQLELGSTPTEYELPITGRELQVNVCGKNLLILSKSTLTANGITATANDDGSITLNGTATANTYIGMWNNLYARSISVGKITINAIDGQSISTYFMGIDRREGSSYIDRIAQSITNNGVGEITQEDVENNRHFYVWVFIAANYTANNLVFRPQLELGDTATEYEPYHGSTTTITPTSNPYTIPNDIRQQEGYNVISVTGGELSVVGVQKNAAIGKLYTNLKPVAFSGSYNDLDDKPETPINSDVTASGNPVIMDNLQGDVPFSEMIVSGKNLLTYPYNETTKTVNGITFTDNGDGTITANGTATANATFLIDKNFGFEKEGNYFLSGCPSGGGLDSFYINWFQNHTGVTIKNYNDYGSGIIIPYQHIFSENNSLAIAIIAGTTVNNLVFRPQLELGDTATTYEPPITGRELTVNVPGKNLIPYPYNRASGTYNGIELIVHDDGRFDISGTATTSFAILVFANSSRPIYLLGGQAYTISCNTPYDYSKFNLSARIYHAAGNYTSIAKFPTTFIAKEGDYLTSTLWIDSDVSVSAKNVELQLELGDTATPYEPYHGSTITITPNSNPYTIPDDIRQQDGYNVISVSAGELSVVGVQRNAAIKKIWDKFASIGNDIVDLCSKISALESDTSASIEANGQEIVAVRHALDELASVPDDIVSLRSDNETLHAEIEELRALIETT